MNPFGSLAGVLSDGHVSNAQLIGDVVAAARESARCVRGGLDRATAGRQCWDYVRAATRYHAETPDAQLVRLPWRFVADGVGDCKSQAIFVAALCAASGCTVVLRFVTLPNDSAPGHVYAVVDGIPVDPLLEYGQECPYIRASDYPIRT